MPQLISVFIFVALQIYDGISADDALMGTYCGNNAPSMITATSNVMYVQFYSDVSITGAGFNATYSQADGMVLDNTVSSRYV